MRVLAGLAVCCALLAAAGCGSGSDAESSQEAQQAARAAERHEEQRLRSQAQRAEARARHRAVRRQARRVAARQHAREAAARAEAEAEERERIENEEGEEAQATTSECDPNYEGACLDPNAYDYDCAGGSGDGPEYTGPVTVVGDDHYGLDADGDGYGCE
jgi:FKBP-type peptidyl-prolyl cis-trans isomerase